LNSPFFVLFFDYKN